MKYILIIFFVSIFFSASAQSPKKDLAKPLTKQDSINFFVAKRDAAIDSVLTKTSLKDFQLWLDENVSSKTMREGKLNELWSTFVNAKLDEWMRKNKIVVPMN